jgi:epsin
LTVLDYCLHQGSENVVIYFRDNIYIIKTLKEFQYVDEDGKDQGANVRQKAKDITNLLMDEDRLREERRSRAHMRDRMIRGTNGEFNREEDDENSLRRDKNSNNGLAGKRPNRDEDELRRAIEESKKSLAQEMLKKEEQELQAALKASEEEEQKRKKDVDDSNASSLFDDASSPSTSTSGGFSLIDPTPYAVGLQPQFTSIQPQMTAMPLQQQFTSFNPYQQQLEQQALQQEYMRQQQEFLAQQQAAQQQQAQEEWMRQQLLQQQQLQLQQQQQQQQQQQLFIPQQLTAQPTGFGTNNPFAPSFQTAGGSPSPSSASTTPSFNLSSTYENHSQQSNLSAVSPQLTAASSSSNPYANKAPAIKVNKNLGENEARLEHLFANRDDGQDTFGNVGALRYGYFFSLSLFRSWPRGRSSTSRNS